MSRIYSLSFILIILLCYSKFSKCSEMYNPFKEVIQSIRNVIPNFNTFLRSLGETINAAIDDECIFRCPNGKRPQPKLFHEPVGNGCGVPGLQIPSYIPIRKLEECCNEHDICYSTCNKEKEICDKYFKNCLYGICSSLQKFLSEDLSKGCKGIAKTLYTAVTAMGCKYYLDAQKEACVCSVNYYRNSANNEL